MREHLEEPAASQGDCEGADHHVSESHLGAGEEVVVERGDRIAHGQARVQAPQHGRADERDRHRHARQAEDDHQQDRQHHGVDVVTDQLREQIGDQEPEAHDDHAQREPVPRTVGSLVVEFGREGHLDLQEHRLR